MTKYLFLITYSFDTDYIVKSFNTEEEAKETLENYLNEEIILTKDAMEYTPCIIRHTDWDITLVYTDNITDDYHLEDHADYRIIKVNF